MAVGIASPVLSEAESVALGVICERLVPGSGRSGVIEYVDRVARSLPAAEVRALRTDIRTIVRLTEDDDALAAVVWSPGFNRLRGLAIEAFYGGYSAEGSVGPTGWEAIGFAPPQAVRIRRDWSFLDERAPG